MVVHCVACFEFVTDVLDPQLFLVNRFSLTDEVGSTFLHMDQVDS